MNTSMRKSAGAKDSGKAGGPASGCCGGPAPTGTNACCAQDAVVKSAGGAGCGVHTRIRHSIREEDGLLRLVEIGSAAQSCLAAVSPEPPARSAMTTRTAAD